MTESFDYTFNFNSSSAVWNEWDQDGKVFTEIKGIPNFFSKTMFGKTSQLRAVAHFVVVFSIVAVFLRMFARTRFRTKLWWDDLFVGIAVFILFANQMVFCLMDFLGRTSFAWTAKTIKEDEKERIEKIVLGLKLTLVCEVFYLVSIYLVKFSMLFLYGRIAKQTKYITLYLRVTQGVCICAFILCVLSLFLSCIPIYKFWNLQNENSECTRRTLLTYSSGISNIVTNTLVLAVPVPLLLRASLTHRQKIGVYILYFFGAFVIVASALRFATLLWNVSVPQAIGWSQVEISLAIILACAPMSAKLLLHPLDTKQYLVRIENSQFSQTDTEVLIDKTTESKKMAGVAPILHGDMGVGDNDLNSHQERLPVVTQGPDGIVVLGEGATPREIQSPDHHKFKVVRTEVDGRMVWEVRPASTGSTV